MPPPPPGPGPASGGGKKGKNNDLPPPPPMPGSFGAPPPPRGPPGAFSDMPPPPPMGMPYPPGPQSPPGGMRFDELPPPPGQSKVPKGAVIKEITPGGLKPSSPPGAGGLRPHGASFSGGSRPNLRAPSPNGLGGKMHRLSVNGDRPDMHNIMAGGRPPGSPLLEAYHGTYQQMSPMPSPLMMGRRFEDDDIDDLEPLDRRSSRGGKRRSS